MGRSKSKSSSTSPSIEAVSPVRSHSVPPPATPISILLGNIPTNPIIRCSCGGQQACSTSTPHYFTLLKALLYQMSSKGLICHVGSQWVLPALTPKLNMDEIAPCQHRVGTVWLCSTHPQPAPWLREQRSLASVLFVCVRPKQSSSV